MIHQKMYSNLNYELKNIIIMIHFRNSLFIRDSEGTPLNNKQEKSLFLIFYFLPTSIIKRPRPLKIA